MIPPRYKTKSHLSRRVSNSYRRSLRSGLTLIELLVVLTILIALGGIVVSSLPGLLERTQAATAAANVPEIDSAIRRQLVTTNGTIGNRFDSLVTDSGQIAAYVGGADFFQPINLNENEILALAEAGITELVPARENPSDATFDSHQQPAVPINSGQTVCGIAGAFAVEIAERIWNLTPTENSRFLIFGLGSRASLVGGGASALFPEAPVHFSDSPNSSPSQMYSRYLLAVELIESSDQLATARFVGVAIPDQRGLRGISQELQDIYSSEPGSTNLN